MTKPGLFYLLTGRANAVLWRLPLPRRVLVRLSGMLYRSPPMPGEVVLGVVEAVEAAGVRCWLAGGWGVDALVGRQTRTHRDLDLVVEHRDMQKAVQVLLALGYWEWYRLDEDVPLSTQIVFTDHPVAGRAVDLHPLEYFGPAATVATGEVAGRQVPCLSVATQVVNRSCTRRSEREDLALLLELERSQAAQGDVTSGVGAGRPGEPG
jgi:lincosamide nucleotidyltransferase A/C/D/E